MKKLISSFIISIIILSNCIISNAANVADLVLTSNSTSVDVGSEIVIYLEINNLSGINELTGIAAKLNYDSNIFELVNITGENSWKVSKAKTILMISDDSVTFGKVIKIVLKAIKVPEEGTSIVELTNISVTDNIEEYEQTNLTYKINVKNKIGTLKPNPKPESEESNLDTDSKQEVEKEESPAVTQEHKLDETSEDLKQKTDIVQNTTQNKNDITDNTVSEINTNEIVLNSLIAIIIILAVIIGITSFIRYKKVKEE